MVTDKQSLITACLLHDMGNIIRFNLERFPEYNEPEGLEYWKNVQNDYKVKYGASEHEATLSILRELGMSQSISDYVEGSEFMGERDSIEGVPFLKRLFCYVDNRVAIYGVTSIEEKNKDYETRYSHDSNIVQNSLNRRRNFAAIEQEIFANCSIKSEDINSTSVEKYIERLKEYSI